MYRSLIRQTIDNPFGLGLSNETFWHNIPIDSGIVSVLFSMGWLGSFLFAAGILHLFLVEGRAPRKGDEFASVCRAIAVALLVMILSGNIFVGMNGMMFWTFAAMNLSGYRLSAAETFPSFERH